MKNKTRHPRTYGRRYPWEDWFSQSSFKVRKASDYNGRTDTFAQLVRNNAPRYGVRVSIKIDRDGMGLTVTVTPRESA
jgi:hypothetical protein